MKKTIKNLRIAFLIMGMLSISVAAILGIIACIYWEHLTDCLGYVLVIAVLWLLCAMFATSKLEEIEQKEKERQNENQGN